MILKNKKTRKKLEKLLFVIPSLGTGGAERVMTILVNAFSELGYSVSLLIYADNSLVSDFSIVGNVKIIRRVFNGYKNAPQRWTKGPYNRINRVLSIRKAVRSERPDAVISFLDRNNIMTVFAMLGLSVPVIVSEHTDPSQRSIGMVNGLLRRWSYGIADALVTLSPEANSFFPPRIQEHSWIIPNPVMVPERAIIERDCRVCAMRPRLIAVGSLRAVKGFDMLLDAFSLIREKHPGWRLSIYGEGSLRHELEKKIAELGLRNYVDLPGATNRIFDEFVSSDIFVMPSRVEGFPMALLEAMALGLPAIAFDCPSGPRQLIRHDVDGVLVPPNDVPALACAMSRLIDSPTERNRLAISAMQVRERFSLKSVVLRWERLLNTVVANTC